MLAYKNFFQFLDYARGVASNPICSILIICDPCNYKIAQSIIQAEPANYSVTLLLIKSSTDLKNLDKLLSQYDLILLFYQNSAPEVSTPKGNLSFLPLVPYIEQDLQRGNVRKILTFFDVEQFFEGLYTYPPTFYKQQNENLINQLKAYKKLTFVTDNSQLITDTKNLSPWDELHGQATHIIPAEIATYAPKLTGSILFTGLILGKLPFTQKYGLINEPILFEIKDAELQNFHTDNAELAKDLDYYFNRSPSNRQICELGIGTNTGLTKLYPVNSFAQERFPGLHLGFGGADKDSIHLDFIFSHDHLKIMGDEDVFFGDGRFLKIQG